MNLKPLWMSSSSNLNICLHWVLIIVCDVVKEGVNSVVVNCTTKLVIKPLGKNLALSHKQIWSQGCDTSLSAAFV